jgi:hypothetical protein
MQLLTIAASINIFYRGGCGSKLPLEIDLNRDNCCFQLSLKFFPAKFGRGEIFSVSNNAIIGICKYGGVECKT